MRIDTTGGVFVRSETTGGPQIWMLHGFGESSLSFQPLLESELARFGLFALDLPGFGVSPAAGTTVGLAEAAKIVAGLIEERSRGAKVGLVGHSLGSAIAVEVAHTLGQRVQGLVSLEGNLTEADAYFSGLAADFDDPNAFKSDFLARVRTMAVRGSDTLWRYHASVTFADAKALWALGCDAKRASRDDALGEAYRAVKCPSLYYWSPESTPQATRDYLEAHEIRDHCDHGGNHWSMVDRSGEVAKVLGSFFDECFATGIGTVA
ncbi:MAG: alpha/beta hydrolase [Deltaproteobacteria bacterium]|nr:alpha/beta hydrolase [Deltaproteobacteria bacterium]